MTLLVGDAGQRADLYAPVESVADLSLAEGPVLVPLTVIDEAIAARRNTRIGLLVANDTPISAIAPYLGAVDLVAVAFPVFSDGRGLSLARRLRRAGFTGTLRASGPLIADQFAEALACGFDEVSLPDATAARQPVAQWMKAKDIVAGHYQKGYATGASILEQRMAARKDTAR